MGRWRKRGTDVALVRKRGPVRYIQRKGFLKENLKRLGKGKDGGDQKSLKKQVSKNSLSQERRQV